jgi:uncharacterized protein YabN with tetrapyrrole methylase and pyrophosphatase domain
LGRKKKQTFEHSPLLKESLLSAVLKKRGLPTLNFGVELAQTANSFGFMTTLFSTQKETGAFDHVLSEIQELQAELQNENFQMARVEDEMGDVVYALCNLLAFLKDARPVETKEIDFDFLVRAAFDKFTVRFLEMEKIMEEEGTPLTPARAKSLSRETWDILWKEAKKRRYR